MYAARISGRVMVAATKLSESEEQRAWSIAASVPDPEVPCVTIEDLGILRGVEISDSKTIARISPTYSGCPAVLAIELAVETALLDAGFDPVIERIISPAWTTDWITESGREKLRAYGIAPPAKGGTSGKLALFESVDISCPRCSSTKTRKISEFGSTACKAQYQCNTCAEPFDYFKCI